MNFFTLRSLCSTRFDSLKWAVGPLGNPITKRASTILTETENKKNENMKFDESEMQDQINNRKPDEKEPGSLRLVWTTITDVNSLLLAYSAI